MGRVRIAPGSYAYGLWQIHHPSYAWIGEHGPEYVVPASQAAVIMTYLRDRYGGAAWAFRQPDADGLVARPTLER